MATTDPITGATINDQGDSAVGGYQIGQIVQSLRTMVLPRFATTAARNAAYDSFVTSGGAMARGMRCLLAGVEQSYNAAGPGHSATAWGPPQLSALVAFRSTNQGIGTGAAAGTVGLDTSEAGAVAGFTLNTSTGVITVDDLGQGVVPVDISAAYTLIQAGSAGASSNPFRAYIAVLINGTEARRGQDQHARGYLNGDLHGRVLPSSRHLLSPNDTIALRYYHDSGQASTITPGAAVTWMSVRRAA